MLNDDQRAQIGAAILGRTATAAEREVCALVEQWLTEALTFGPLPEGWERAEQWRHSTPWSYDQSPQDRRDFAELYKPRHAVVQRREVITGPWEE